MWSAVTIEAYLYFPLLAKYLLASHSTGLLRQCQKITPSSLSVVFFPQTAAPIT